MDIQRYGTESTHGLRGQKCLDISQKRITTANVIRDMQIDLCAKHAFTLICFHENFAPRIDDHRMSAEDVSIAGADRIAGGDERLILDCPRDEQRAPM